MMKAESDLTNFILLRPTDLLNIVSTLTIQSSDELDRTKLAYLKEQGCSSEKFLMQMFSASDVKEMITLLKDLCVVVPCKGSSTQSTNPLLRNSMVQCLFGNFSLSHLTSSLHLHALF